MQAGMILQAISYRTVTNPANVPGNVRLLFLSNRMG